MNIIEWMIAQGIAKNGFQAAHISEGLKLPDCDREAQESRCVLYRRWKPKTDKASKELTSKEAYDLAIAGIDPDDVPERQIEMFEEDDDYGYAEQKNFD